MKIKSVIRFGSSVILFIIALWLINLLSGELEKDTLRSYKTIDEVRTILDDIIIPTYFPESLLWPPSRLLASKRPYRTVIMEFRDKNKNLHLVITESEKDDIKASDLYLTEVHETLQHRIKNRNVLIITGKCNKERCSKIFWKEGRYFINITIRSDPFELLRLAESMMPPMN